MKLVKYFLIAISVLLMLLGIITIILFVMGYRPMQTAGTFLDWSAFGSLAEWVAGFAAIAIPIAIFLLDKRMKERDTKLLKELNDFKNEYENKLKALATLVTPEGDIVIDGGTLEVKNVNPEWGEF